jgi:predicted dehydrogenase
VLLTQAIHTLDLMLSIAGPIAEVASYVTTTPVHRMETEDFCAAAIVFENGALGTIEATTSAFPGFPERIDIVGEAGSASVFGTELKVVWKDGRTAEFGSHATRGGAGADPMDFPHDYHRDLIADFLDAIAAGCEPTVNGAEALKVHRLIDALLESGATGRRVRVSGG